MGCIVISEHVLRRAAKLSSSQKAGFDCFLLGTPNLTNQTVSVSVDRMDHGKETISGFCNAFKIYVHLFYLSSSFHAYLMLMSYHQ